MLASLLHGLVVARWHPSHAGACSLETRRVPLQDVATAERRLAKAEQQLQELQEQQMEADEVRMRGDALGAQCAAQSAFAS
jgi:hypothetical protein